MLQRMVHIDWTERRTNTSIIRAQYPELTFFIQRIISSWNKVTREPWDTLQGNVNGIKPNTKAATRYIDQIKDTTNAPLQVTTQKVEDCR